MPALHHRATSRLYNLDRTSENVDLVYDRTHQLVTGNRTGTTDDEAYAYDGTGNRTTANGSTYTTTSNNRLTNDGTFTYTYDDEGNRLTRVRISGAAADDKTVEYTWDYRNRLEKVTFKRNDGTVTKTVDLRYDMFNQLTQRVIDPDGALGSTPTQTEDYLWDGDELVGVYGYRSLVFAYGPYTDMVLFESEDGTALHALLGDHQNTVRDVISTSGTVENHLVYNSYGELKSQTGGGAYSPFHRFTGKPFDVAVGLQYNVNRWYDAATGRWTSEDPIGFGGGDANLSAYTGNSPIGRLDSFGLWPVEPGAGFQTWKYRIPIDRSAEWEEFAAREKLLQEAEIRRRLENAPSLAEPSAEELAHWGIAIATGGLLGYIKEGVQTAIEAFLDPAPGPAPGRLGGGGGGGGGRSGGGGPIRRNSPGDSSTKDWNPESAKPPKNVQDDVGPEHVFFGSPGWPGGPPIGGGSGILGGAGGSPPTTPIWSDQTIGPYDSGHIFFLPPKVPPDAGTIGPGSPTLFDWP